MTRGKTVDGLLFHGSKPAKVVVAVRRRKNRISDTLTIAYGDEVAIEIPAQPILDLIEGVDEEVH